MTNTSDLSVIYITANHIPERFARNTQNQLIAAIGDLPLVSVSKEPMAFGTNICVGDTTRSQYNIYIQAQLGAEEAKTKYVAIAEDDVLYSPEHFKYRPKPQTWAYNMNSWSLFTWGEPMFTQKPGGRRNFSQLICERQLLIDHLEERFRLWPEEAIDVGIFGEPGKYDNQLGTTSYPSEDFYTNPPNIVFSHQTNLQFQGLGTRKRVGQIRATEIPVWGRADDLLGLYK